jgi:hypothetical protein
LHEVDLNVVEQFLCFIIRGEIQLPNHDSENEILPVRLWVFADQNLMPKLQNQAMTYLFDTFGGGRWCTVYPLTQTIAEALVTSTPDSALYRFMFSRLLKGVHTGTVYQEGPEAVYHMGKYTSEDLAVFERIPKLLIRLMYESRLWNTNELKLHTLTEYSVREN